MGYDKSLTMGAIPTGSPVYSDSLCGAVGVLSPVGEEESDLVNLSQPLVPVQPATRNSHLLYVMYYCSGALVYR